MQKQRSRNAHQSDDQGMTEFSAYLRSFRRYPVLKTTKEFNELYARFQPWHVRVLKTEEQIVAAQQELEKTDSEAGVQKLQEQLYRLNRRKERYVRGRDHYAAPLICGNIRLTALFARRYAGRGISLPDLIQEGYFGLRTALFKFNPALGYKFSTYAGNWITNQMRRYVQKHGNHRAVSTPIHVQEILSRFSRQISQFQNEQGREPTNEELAERIDLKKGETRIQLLKKIIRYRPQIGMGGNVSLNAHLGAHVEEGSIFQDVLKSETLNPENFCIARSMHKKHVRKAAEWIQNAEHLSERDRAIIFHSFGLGGYEAKTHRELGREYGITRQRIEQIEERFLHAVKASRKELLWHIRSLQELDAFF